MNNFTSTVGREIDTLEARINNFLATPPSDTATVDAEVLDLRVTHDGRTFNTAGEAVREVSEELHDNGAGTARRMNYITAFSCEPSNLLVGQKTGSGHLVPGDGAMGIGVGLRTDEPGKAGVLYRVVANFPAPIAVYVCAGDALAYKHDVTFRHYAHGDNWCEFITNEPFTGFAVRLENNVECDFTVSLFEGAPMTTIKPAMLAGEMATFEDYIINEYWYGVVGSTNDARLRSQAYPYIKEITFTPTADSAKQGLCADVILEPGKHYKVIMRGVKPAMIDRVYYGTVASWGAGSFAPVEWFTEYNEKTNTTFIHVFVTSNTVDAKVLIIRTIFPEEITFEIAVKEACEPFKPSENTKVIAFCGDSLTAQGYSAYVDTVNTKINFAVGGEGFEAISERTGIRPLYYENPTIKPGRNEIVLSHAGLFAQGMGNINPVTIAGVEGVLEVADGKYYFTPNTEITEKSVYRPTVIPNQNKLNVVMNVYWTGTNNLGVSTAEQIFAEWEKILAVKPNTIILGMTNDRDEVRKAKVAALDVLGEKLGMRYLPVHDWLVENGITFSGLTPNGYDAAAIEAGKIPPALLSDTTHFNTHGQKCIAHLVTERLRMFNID